MHGVRLTPLKKIATDNGEVLHALRNTDQDYRTFGEAYLSTIRQGSIRAWKKHRELTLNIVVPLGEIRFVLYDDRDDSPSYGQFEDLTLSRSRNYQRLTVFPGIWMGFQGLGIGDNMLLNVIDGEHDPSEIDRARIESIAFEW